MTLPGYQAAPIGGSPPATLAAAASTSWVRRIAEIVNTILRGKINVVLPVTLAANAGTTIVIDARIGPYSALLFAPVTAHAAAEIAAGGFYVSAQQNGEATLIHANSAQNDRSFNMAIMG